ncbi:MAG: ATP-dependent Clp protease ATP-binding subunit ClpX [Bacteroidales bacterium]|nr:ATP-dependent Clp protease ATP-binding subunit ClpX [Bacteroidales bacterium]
MNKGKDSFKDINKKCSFCGREKQDVTLLITGINANICDFCVDQAQSIIKEEGKSSKSKFSKFKLRKPKDIKAYLDEYVIGQEAAKKILSVAVYNHYKRIMHFDKGAKNDIEIEKSNVIFVGETGTGKTLMAKTIAKMLDVPFCIADATVLTEAGYVGEDVESVLVRLLQVADYDIAAVERGIVFIDEIDKIARKKDNPSITRDVSGEGVQQALLKLLEGSVINVPPKGGRKHPEQKMLQINTENILFICGGAFDGIDKIIATRMKANVIGYQNQNNDKNMLLDNIINYVGPQDLKKFGLIPELVGRLPIVAYLNALDKDALLRILTEPKNALVKQYAKLFEMDGITLNIEENVLEYIVDKAIEFKLGARGLRSICEAIMTDAMYDLPSKDVKEVTITREFAVEKLSNVIKANLKVA